MQEYRGTHGNQRLSDMNTRSKAVQGSNQTREGLESPGFSRGEDVNDWKEEIERLHANQDKGDRMVFGACLFGAVVLIIMMYMGAV